MPVVTPSHASCIVQALLYDGPIAGARQYERMQVKLKAIADGVVIDLGGQTTGSHQRRTVEICAIRDRQQFGRSFSRLLSAPAADIDTKLMSAWIQAAFQRAEHGCCNSR